MTTQQDQGAEQVTVTPADVAELAAVDPHAPHKDAEVVLQKDVFCAGCQEVTKHKMSVDKNNEIVATCDCGRALKFPLFDQPEDFDAHLKAHHASNTGQVSVEQFKAARAVYDEKLKKLVGN